MKKNGVIFKGSKNGINVILDENLEFEELKALMARKLVDADKFFGGAKTAITFSGRELSDSEEEALLGVISERSGINISFVGEMNGAMRKSGVFSQMENFAYFHKGNLRSGQEIRYDGSVVVIGDVNPGGEIIAKGNVIVLGVLMGVVHAGCMGSRECYAAALSLEPTQLRIADVISYMPPFRSVSRRRRIAPAYAYINDGRIYVEPLTN